MCVVSRMSGCVGMCALAYKCALDGTERIELKNEREATADGSVLQQ